MAREDFLKYAASYSGVDGGDIDAEYWFMGMEWSDIDDIKGHYDKAKNIWIEQKNFPQQEIKLEEKKDDKYVWKLERKINELYQILPSKVSGKVVFQKNSNSLKLNLLPLPFKGTSEHNDNWQEYRYDIMTGFECFCKYKKGIIAARQKLFYDLLKKGKTPKTIFCFGKTYQDDFLQALTGNKNLQANKIDNLEHFDKNVFVYNNVNHLIKKIIICYFPCPPGGKQFDDKDWKQICNLAKE